MATTLVAETRALASFDPLPMWCAWKHWKSKKPPISMETGCAAEGDLGTRAQAQAAAERFGDGIGLVLGPLLDDAALALGMVDFDGLRDPETGELAGIATEIIDRFNSYAETSPSQAGAKQFFLYRTEHSPKIKKLIVESKPKGRSDTTTSWMRGTHLEIQFFIDASYGTVTGHASDNHSTLIGEPKLRIVDFATLRWVIEEAGPRYLADLPQCCGASRDQSGSRDPSGSGHGWHFCRDRFRAGDNIDAVREALMADDGEAGAWAARAPEREVTRTLGKAEQDIAAQRASTLAMLSDDDVAGVNERSPDRVAADAAFAFGDVFNGAAHADRLRGTRLYVSMTGQSLQWSGERWVAQMPEDVMADAKETSAALVARATAALTGDPSERNRALLNKAGRLHGSAAALTRMVEMARSESGMSVPSPDFFDRDPYALTLCNGLLSLRTGALRPARAEDRVSRLAGCAFDPAATCPQFDRFLATVLPDPEIRAFVQRAVGYSLTGSVDEEVFFVAHGTGSNGKSVFANIVAAVLGEYSGAFGAALVTRNKHENEAARMLTRLPGLRLALVNETGVADLWDSARMKELASRERMAARELYSKSFDFMPTAKLWIRTNHLPGSLDAGHGFWRRCVPIPFTVQVPHANRVLDLDRVIIATELAGVLNWAVAGAMAWARDGLQVPTAIRAEVDVYREETDMHGQWLAERTVADPRGVMPVGKAFLDYEAFCRNLGMSGGSAPTFSRALASLGLKRDPSRKHGRRFLGVRLGWHTTP